MIINGVSYPTVEEASRDLGLSAKTIYEHIRKGIIDEPPEMAQGVRTVRIFPPDYLAKAKQQIEEHRKQRKEQQRGGR